MKEYQHKHMIRTLLYSRVTIIFLFLLCILLLRSIMELNDKRIEVAKLRSDSEIGYNKLKEKANFAQKQNNEIATERGLEAYVRATYPVVKEGEGVIVIYEGEKGLVSPVRADMTIWERLLVLWHAIVRR